MSVRLDSTVLDYMLQNGFTEQEIIGNYLVFASNEQQDPHIHYEYRQNEYRQNDIGIHNNQATIEDVQFLGEEAPGFYHHENVEVSAQRTRSVFYDVIYGHNILVYNPLSFAWNAEAIKENPKIIFSGLLLMPFGMIGYVLSLPMRVGIFVHTLFKMLKEIFTLLWEGEEGWQKKVKTRLLILGGATGELASGMIGCVLPPLAYKMDEWIQSNQTIHRYYDEGRGIPLSRWSAPEELHKKRSLPNGFRKCLSLVKGELVKVHKDAYISPMPVVLQEAFMLALFMGLQKNIDFDGVHEHAIRQIEHHAKTNEIIKIKGEIEPNIREELMREEPYLTDDSLEIEVGRRVSAGLKTQECEKRIEAKVKEAVDNASLPSYLVACKEALNFLTIEKKLRNETILSLFLAKLTLETRKDDEDDEDFFIEGKENQHKLLIENLDNETSEKLSVLYEQLKAYCETISANDKDLYKLATEKALF